MESLGYSEIVAIFASGTRRYVMKRKETNTNEIQGMWQIFPHSRIYIPTKDPNIVAQATKFNMGIDKYGFAPITKKNCETFIKFCEYIREGLDCARDKSARDAMEDVLTAFESNLRTWTEVQDTTQQVTVPVEILPEPEDTPY